MRRERTREDESSVAIGGAEGELAVWGGATTPGARLSINAAFRKTLRSEAL
jgi:hypothetical protein